MIRLAQMKIKSDGPEPPPKFLKMVHSVAEIKLSDGWYIFDIANLESKPEKGVITKESPYKDYKLWQKGRDAWDLGLASYEDISKII